MRDALGRKIEVGDIVVKGKFDAYAEINLAEVIALTPKKVKLVRLDKYFRRVVQKDWNGHDWYLSYPESVLVINETAITIKQVRIAKAKEMGIKQSEPWEAGVFYCPNVPETFKKD